MFRSPTGAARLLDAWLYRYPFEGASAARYARGERCGFGDLDDRLIDRWRPELAAARRLIDIGAGPGHLTERLAARYPDLELIAVEPSRAYNRQPIPGVRRLRARAERLPLATDCADVAVMLSSIRHVADRPAALRELRRVVAPGGVAFILELDPASDRRRRRNHARALRSLTSRLAFTPLVLWTAPPAETFTRLALASGWRSVDRADDPEQPLYILRLT